MDKNLRKFENYHIVLWLVKDLCWALVWRPLGIAMIIPTVALAIYIAYKSTKDRFEFLHNVAVCCWICANATWMAGEFYNYKTQNIAVVFFVIGLLLIANSYVFRKKETT